MHNYDSCLTAGMQLIANNQLLLGTIHRQKLKPATSVDSHKTSVSLPKGPFKDSKLVVQLCQVHICHTDLQVQQLVRSPGKPQSGGAGAAGSPTPTSGTWQDTHRMPTAAPASKDHQLIT